MSRPSTLLALVLSFGAVPTAHAGEDTDRVAVLPINALAVPADVCMKVRSQLTEALRSKFDIEIVTRADTDAAVQKMCGPPPTWWECLGRDDNLLAVGDALRVRTVVGGRLAAMGQKRVLKLRVVEVATGRTAAEVVDVPAGEEETVLARALLLHERLFPAREPVPTWYERWETWTIAGAGLALVAGAVVLGVVLSADEGNSGADLTLVLPR